MRKRIALLADGCAYEYMGETFYGIRDCAAQKDLDVYAFVSFSFRDEGALENIGEQNIFNLPDLSQFDGVIVAVNSFNSPAVQEMLEFKLVEAGVPVVCLENTLSGFPVVRADNEAGTYALTKHLIEIHEVSDIVYIAGIQVNGESNARCAGIERALEEHGLKLDPENILSGNWDCSTALKLMREWLEAHPGRIPDAVMGANDMSAIGACEALAQAGYRVPEDVIVTGYDNLHSARVYSPGITSINRKAHEIGEKGVELLCSLMEGEEVPEESWVKVSVAIEESCGCFNQFRNIGIRNRDCRKTTMDAIFNREMEQKAWALKRNMSEATGLRAISDVISEHMRVTRIFNGCRYGVLLDPVFFGGREKERFRKSGYSKIMDVLFVSEPAKAAGANATILPASQLVPYEPDESEPPHGYFFLPVHGKEKCYGYAVFENTWELLPNLDLYNWTETISQGLEQVDANLYLERLNKKLYETSVRDMPSGLYNRTGYDQIVIPSLKTYHNAGVDTALAIVDINKMKQINDNWGHLQGDLAIGMVAKALRDAKREDWYAIRYGGDEFLLAGPITALLDATEILARIQPIITDQVKETGLSFRVSVSYGMAVLPAGEPFDLDRAVKVADAAMYEMKQRLHKIEEAGG